MTDTMRERFNAVAVDLLDDDPQAVVVLAVIGSSGFPSDVRDRFCGRIIDVGIR